MSVDQGVSRRRFISIVGASAATLAVPMSTKAAAKKVTWRGRAMGAESAMTLYHDDPGTAKRILALCAEEIDRLESIFSLFRPSSALTALNTVGHFDHPPRELVELLGYCNQMSEISDGAFDVTIQPLWDLYARHFAAPDPDPLGPGAEEVAQVHDLVGWKSLRVSKHQISMTKPGMAISLNGVAQGFVTDRISDVLAQNGIENVLVNLGEMRGIGAHPDGKPWRVGVFDPASPEILREAVNLRNKAVASSGGYGTEFDDQGRFHHLFNPITGAPTRRWRAVTVVAPWAVRADALSTALAAAPGEDAPRILREGGGNRAILVSNAGKVQRISVDAT